MATGYSREQFSRVDRVVGAREMAELAIECCRTGRYEIRLEIRLHTIGRLDAVVQQGTEHRRAARHSLRVQFDRCASCTTRILPFWSQRFT